MVCARVCGSPADISKCLLGSNDGPKRCRPVYASTVGLVFFGTPFRGDDVRAHTELLCYAKAALGHEKVLEEVPDAFKASGELLGGLVERFLTLLGNNPSRPMILCIFEVMKSAVLKIVDRALGQTPDQTHPDYFWVGESSAKLDSNATTESFSRPRNHFDLNKYRDPMSDEFRVLASRISEMAQEAPRILQERRM